MLDLDEINRVVDKAASAALKGVGLSRVYTEPTVDSEGHDALRVTIVLTGNRDREIDGDAALDAIVQISNDLQKLGEERFPIIEFATENELESDDDNEP